MFDNIIGNEKNKKILQDIIKKNIISHSYMFIGQSGIGKQLFAKEFAKNILCINKKNGESCGNCKSCTQFDSLNNPDFNIIEPDGESIKIEQIRNMIQKVYEKPITSEKKVYIINDAEKMTKEAGNCLLKTLEEPPEYITIILIVFSENMMLNTIRSRCHKINFVKLTNDEINKYFGQKFDNKMLSVFDGSIRKANLTKDKSELFKSFEDIVNSNVNLIDFLEKCSTIYTSKEDIYDILDYINLIFIEKLKDNLDNYETSKYIKCIELVEQTKIKIKHNANFDMSIDNLLFKIYRLIK